MDPALSKWREAFERESARKMDQLLVEYGELFRDLLDDTGVKFEWPPTSPASLNIPTTGRAVVAKAADSEAMLLLSPVVSGTNVPKQVVGRLVGTCPACLRPAPLDPGIFFPSRTEEQHRRYDATLGEALLLRRVSDLHDCAAATSAQMGGDDYRPGTYA